MTFTDTLKKMSAKSAFSHFDAKLKYEIGPVELKEKMDQGETNFDLLDVRSKEAYEGGHIPGAKSVPFTELNFDTYEFSEFKENIVYCYNHMCQLGDHAAYWLAEHGYPVKLLIGGFDGWERNEFPVEK